MGSEVLRAEVLSYFELICLLKPFHKKLVSDTDLWFRSSVGPAEGSFLEGGVSHRQARVQDHIVGLHSLSLVGKEWSKV